MPGILRFGLKRRASFSPSILEGTERKPSTDQENGGPASAADATGQDEARPTSEPEDGEADLLEVEQEDEEPQKEGTRTSWPLEEREPCWEPPQEEDDLDSWAPSDDEHQEFELFSDDEAYNLSQQDNPDADRQNAAENVSTSDNPVAQTHEKEVKPDQVCGNSDKSVKYVGENPQTQKTGGKAYGSVEDLKPDNLFTQGGLLEEIRSDDTGKIGFLRSKTLGERLREKTWTNRRSTERDQTPTPDHVTSPGFASTPSPTLDGSNRISRIFSLRRSYDHAHTPEKEGIGGMHPLTEEEETVLGEGARGPNISPPVLPPAPLFASPEQTKRRFIINSLVQSENNYLESLQRLLNDYKKPLEESSPPILSESKVCTIFYRVSEILHCHSIFRIALSEAVRKWDQEEKIGDAFVASFSKSVVLEVYSDFINNFTEAMEVAKTESKRKSAFADFLKVKQITAHDRLNFYGLIVKPIQRFPQFILLLQDLLKETPPGHSDRMALQLALTTLESLAEMLNERKRESEQIAAFRAKMRQIGGKLGKSECGRVLLREDDVQRLEFNSCGQVSRTKPRRLLLLNDRVICVASSGRPSDVDINASQNEKLNLKWSAGVDEIEVIEGAGTGTLARLTTAGAVQPGKKSSLTKTNSNNVDKQMAENLAQDMADLMHDFDLVSRINTMASGLKCDYPGLSSETLGNILDSIQKSIRQKDDEMSWLDKSCLQVVVKRKEKTETLTFQMRSPAVKQDWVVELRLARLALSPDNSPGWDILDSSKFTGRLPLYVQHIPVLKQDKQTEIVCGTSYTLLVQTPTRTLRPITYVWVNATDGQSSNLKVFSVQVNQKISLKELGAHFLSSCNVRALQYVPGGAVGIFRAASLEHPLSQDLVWVATDDRRILLYGAYEPEKGREVGRIVLQAEPVCLVQHSGQVFVGLSSGTLNAYRRALGHIWDLENPVTRNLGNDPVTALLPVSGGLYTATGRKVVLLETNTFSTLRQIIVNGDELAFKGSVMSLHPLLPPGSVSHMAVAGVGLWIAMANSSNIALYHTESFIHLQDINIASNVSRVLAARDVSSNRRNIFVTALAAAKGLLWVGTNVGIALTIPLPRLEGVPIISGKANISYHAHFGPVKMFLPIVQKVSKCEPAQPSSRQRHQTIPEESVADDIHQSSPSVHRVPLLKQMSEITISESRPSGLSKQFSSPVLGARKPARETRESSVSLIRKSSKTLPRGFTIGPGSESSGDSVFGLYGELMNVEEYDYDPAELETSNKEIHRSDPDLDTISYRVNTLDRRVTMKSQRPRSLDLSSWSVESRGSNQTTSSSETGSVRTSPSVSRTASFASDRSNPSDASGRSTLARTLTREEPESQPKLGTSPSPSLASNPKDTKDSKDKDKDYQQRTVITLMGGRGYIQWHAAHLERNKTSHLAQINNNDAYLVIWDFKV